jgi:hypothetical protein
VQQDAEKARKPKPEQEEARARATGRVEESRKPRPVSQYSERYSRYSEPAGVHHRSEQRPVNEDQRPEGTERQELGRKQRAKSWGGISMARVPARAGDMCGGPRTCTRREQAKKARGAGGAGR